MKITDSLVLPCGAVLKNRIAKSAMSENLANAHHQSNQKLEHLYRVWAEGGTGLLITGNIMIDQSALGEPNNIVFEEGLLQPNLKPWAQAGTVNGTHLWVQLNHPGKQSPQFLSPEPVAPSAISLKPPLDRLFRMPRALSESEIYDLIHRFGQATLIAKQNGFTGAQIHGAHGYLVSQFLSPLHNTRTDQWGGSIQNRMRFVKEVYRSMREAAGPAFPIGIKLNSADFQRGGFSNEESMLVAQALSEEKIDLIEISGGTYESPEMTGQNKQKNYKDSTRAREAYFLEYCEKIRKHVKTPLMLTGGFRSLEGMNAALATSACDVIGLARSLALQPEFSNELLAGKDSLSLVRPLSTGSKKLDQIFPLEIIWYTEQLRRISVGRHPKANLSVWTVILKMILSFGFQSLKRVRGN